MELQISKSEFKPQILRYLQQVLETGKHAIITDNGKPVLKIVPFCEETEDILKSLRNTVIKYEDPFEPIGVEDWEAMK